MASACDPDRKGSLWSVLVLCGGHCGGLALLTGAASFLVIPAAAYLGAPVEWLLGILFVGALAGLAYYGSRAAKEA